MSHSEQSVKQRPLADDPLNGIGITDFGEKLRSGRITSEATTQAYLARIAALDSRLGAFQHVASESALATARAIDALVKAGVDLGPLMGVPVAVKDLFAVNGMPTTAGSLMDVSDLLPQEASFVTRLRQLGCVILGKTVTVEFAFGAVGTNSVRGTPHNPWDANVARIPGGSSSGSAVAVAARLCAFALGSDTGGSVRLPAALCGIFGLKTTVGLWSTDGVFPLSPTLDSIGILTRSASDAALIFGAIAGRSSVAALPLDGVRLGRPTSYLFEDLDPAVAKCSERAIELLQKAGASIVAREMSNVRERETFFSPVLSSELLATFGRERFEAHRDAMDPMIGIRLARGLDVKAADYIRLIWRHNALKRQAARELDGFDGWVTPTATILPAPVSDCSDIESGMRLGGAITRNTQPMNLFGQCGTSTPIQMLGASLPVGLQITCNPLEEERALGIALALENLFGLPPQPDLSSFD